MNYFIRSEKPLTLQRLCPLFQRLRACGQLEGKEKEDKIRELLRQEEAYGVDERNDFLMREREVLAHMPFWQQSVQVKFAPLVVSHHTETKFYPLLEGLVVGAWSKEHEMFSPLAHLWLRAVGGRTLSFPVGQIDKVAAGEGIALLRMEKAMEREEHEVQRVREHKQHDVEHVDEGMLLLQANVDDSSPEWLAYVMECLFQAGANDVVFFPITMKKSRPGVMIQVMCYESSLAAMKEILFKETTTFGIRHFPVACHRLARRFCQVVTPWGEVPVKVGYYREERVQLSPEYDVCAKIAKNAGIPIQQVYQTALRQAEHLAPLQLELSYSDKEDIYS